MKPRANPEDGSVSHDYLINLFLSKEAHDALSKISNVTGLKQTVIVRAMINSGIKKYFKKEKK